MAEEQQRASEPLTGALGDLDPAVGRVIGRVVEDRDPALARRLRESTDVSTEDRTATERILADELEWGPDWEPTPRGKEIDHALGWFLERFPIEH